jgi:hypothetical protein
MGNPISIFIMDVSRSSINEKVGEELEVYLNDIMNWVKVWTDGIVNIKISHRMGDEIFFIGENYATAYTIAFYISRIWKYKKHQPYFGLTFGNINKNLHEINIETWIHPIVKKARIANDELKKEIENRQQFKFELDNYIESNHLRKPLEFHEPTHHLLTMYELALNALLKAQEICMDKQTDLQKYISSLYLILMQQKKIAAYLHKTPATISSHLNKGNGKEILRIFDCITELLLSLQINLSKLENSLQPLQAKKNQIGPVVHRDPIMINEILNKKIKQYISDHMDVYFQVEHP